MHASEQGGIGNSTAIWTCLSPMAQELARIASEAGRVILDHYATGGRSRLKQDRSPVTEADEQAEVIIEGRLRALAPGTPIVAEEAVATGRKPHLETEDRFFLVDPLDGTKEFLARNDEFTVNIALVEGGLPVCGVVFAPALDRMFVGESLAGHGHALEIGALAHSPLETAPVRPLHARPPPAEGGLVALVSRSHRDTESEKYLQQFQLAQLIAAGSSLKFCMIARGEADLYPRHGRTMEWDTAAGHAVLAAAGGEVTEIDGMPLLYGKVASGLVNPPFVARGLRA